MARARLLFLLAAIPLLAAAVPAGAVLDPRSDGMGVYFDPGAEIVCGTTSPFSALSVYLVLTSGSAPNLTAWEAGLTWAPIGDAQFQGTWSLPGCIDVAGTAQNGQFQVGCGTRPLVAPAMVLAVWNGVFFGSAGAGAALTLGGLSGSTVFAGGLPGYLWEDEAHVLRPVPCHVPVADPSQPCAMLNVPGCEELVVSAERTSWGALKSLYDGNRP